jgi:hypothetical protein
MHTRSFAPALALALAVARVALAGPAVTVYNHDLGFVRETRSLEVKGARDTVRLEDIPERLDFSSVRLTPAAPARVVGLAYRYDVATGDALIERARGQRVRVHARENRVIEGTLVSADGSWLVVRGDDGAVSALGRQAVDEVRLANPPKELSLRPVLEAVVEGAAPGRVAAELSFLTGGLSWSAEHTLVRVGETSVTWSASVTVDNQSGREYRDGALKLVAGEPRRAATPPMPMARGTVLEMSAAKSDLSEQTFSEYHLYTLDHTATLRDRESRALTMLEPRRVKVTSRYLYRGGAPGVALQVVIENTAAAGLGVPLPAGRVRFYETDPAGALQFTGETNVGHIAAGETLSLDMGTAFDLAVDRRLVADRRISDREREQQVEIKLRNRKRNGVTIVVEEPIGGEVEVTQQSQPVTRKDANTLQFTVPVAAGQEVVLTYTVRIRY